MNAEISTSAGMNESLPVLLIPGLFASPRLYAGQIPALGQQVPVMVAGPMRETSVGGIARDILAATPPRFGLVGLSMGGYVAFEILRQAPQRVAALALLNTSARADTAEQSENRREEIALARTGRFAELPDLSFPHLVHPMHRNDERLRKTIALMAEESGPQAFIRQQIATINRPDSRPDLADIDCPTLVLSADGDAVIPNECTVEIAAAIPGARRIVVRDCGHVSAIEQPEQVTRALLKWLDEFPSRGGTASG